MKWLKKAWVWILAGIGILAGVAMFFLTFGKKKPQIVLPTLPKQPKVPMKPVVESKPADKYEEEAKKIEEDKTDVVDSINERFK
jgi:uncharacterized membrane protein YhiD involved in acid resistance